MTEEEEHEGQEPDYYMEDGLLVMTESYHRKRGYCCGSKCRHCPYEYKEVPKEERP